MRIDIHTHLGAGAGAVNELLAAADALQMDKTVVFAASRYATGLADNTGVFEAVRSHADRLIPFAFIALGEDGPDVVDRWVEAGARGFKLINPARAYNDESLFSVYARMEASGLPALFHTGIVGRNPGQDESAVDATRMQIMTLDRVARAFSRLTIIAAHLGNPNHEDGAVMIRTHPNVYADLSGSTLKYRTPDYLNGLLWWGKGDAMYNRGGQTPWDKIVYGSDTVPGLAADIVAETRTTHADYQRFFDRINLPEADRRKVMGENAARLLTPGPA